MLSRAVDDRGHEANYGYGIVCPVAAHAVARNTGRCGERVRHRSAPAERRARAGDRQHPLVGASVGA
jgi:hypothetical protein